MRTGGKYICNIIGDLCIYTGAGVVSVYTHDSGWLTGDVTLCSGFISLLCYKYRYYVMVMYLGGHPCLEGVFFFLWYTGIYNTQLAPCFFYCGDCWIIGIILMIQGNEARSHSSKW